MYDADWEVAPVTLTGIGRGDMKVEGGRER